MAIFPTPILLYFLDSLIERIEHLEEIEVGRENGCERKACPPTFRNLTGFKQWSGTSQLVDQTNQQLNSGTEQNCAFVWSSL